MARTPLVVLNATVFPATRSGVYSAGELPNANPPVGSPPPLAAQHPTGPRAAAGHTVRASSTSRQGITSRAPASRAKTVHGRRPQHVDDHHRAPGQFLRIGQFRQGVDVQELRHGIGARDQGPGTGKAEGRNGTRPVRFRLPPPPSALRLTSPFRLPPLEYSNRRPNPRAPMHGRCLSDFLEELGQAGELVRVEAEVDPPPGDRGNHRPGLPARRAGPAVSRGAGP